LRKRYSSIRKKRFIDKKIEEGEHEFVAHVLNYYCDKDLDEGTDIAEIICSYYKPREKFRSQDFKRIYHIEEEALRRLIVKVNAFAEKKWKQWEAQPHPKRWG